MTGIRQAVLITTTLALLVACGQEAKPPETQRPEREPVEVRVEVLHPVELPDRTPLVGTVRARETIVVSSKVPSYIRAIHVREGDRVAKSQRLIDLDARELGAALEAAEAARSEAESAIRAAEHGLEAAQAQRELAEATYRRFKDLLEKESVSQQEYDEALARLRSAEAAVRVAESKQSQAASKKAQAEAQITSARTMRGYATISVGASGMVTKRFADPGTLASPGMPLLEIEPAGHYRLEVAVPESLVRHLRTGQTLDLAIDALGESGPQTGRVTEIVPEADPHSRTSIAKLTLPPHTGLRTGLYGRAFLPGESRESLTVPAQAVIERGQLQSLFVVDEGRAHRRLISLGALEDGRFEVLSGLQAGEQAILNPSDLTDGDPVRITAEESAP